MCCFVVLGNHVMCNCGFLFSAYGGFNHRFILKFVSDIKLLFPGCNSQPVHAHWSWSNCRRSIITEHSWRCVRVFVCACARIHTYVRVRVCMCLCVGVSGWVCLCLYMCMCMCMHSCMSVSLSTCACLCYTYVLAFC